jgi:hypothetical protein
MKQVQYLTKTIVVAAFAFASGFTSCITDLGAYEREQQVEIELSAGTPGSFGTVDNPATRATASTRATDDGDKKDRVINSLRVMGFRSLDGTLAFNTEVFMNSQANLESYTGKVLVVTGRFTIVVVANEHSDSRLSRTLRSLILNWSKLDDVIALPVVSAFGSAWNIPMMSRLDNVQIRPDGVGTPVPGTTNLGSPLRIGLERLGIRIDLKLKLHPDQADAWWYVPTDSNDSGPRLYFDNAPFSTYLSPRDNSQGATSCSFLPGKAPSDIDGDGMLETERKRIILSELLFTPIDNRDKALVIFIERRDGKRLSGTIAIDRGTGPEGYTIPRNTFLRVTATARANVLETEVESVVEDWGSEDLPQHI